MRLIVCGGRDYQDRNYVFTILDRGHKKRNITTIIHGAAKGADSLAADWAKARGIPCEAYPAGWERFGKAAGFKRNTLMLTKSPDGVLGFPGGRGTTMMLDLASKAGIKTWKA